MSFSYLQLEDPLTFEFRFYYLKLRIGIRQNFVIFQLPKLL